MDSFLGLDLSLRIIPPRILNFTFYFFAHRSGPDKRPSDVMIAGGTLDYEPVGLILLKGAISLSTLSRTETLVFGLTFVMFVVKWKCRRQLQREDVFAA